MEAEFLDIVIVLGLTSVFLSALAIWIVFKYILPEEQLKDNTSKLIL